MTWFVGLPETEQRLVAVKIAVDSYRIGHGASAPFRVSDQDIFERADALRSYILYGAGVVLDSD